MLIAILLLAIVLSACIASNAQQPELSSFSKLSEIIARWRARRGDVACGVNYCHGPTCGCDYTAVGGPTCHCESAVAVNYSWTILSCMILYSH
jgi:hypothetical protein